jgi:DNA mismatch repair protein MutS2
MKEKYLRILEYDKIKNMLKEHTTSRLSHVLVDELEPLSDIKKVRDLQHETREAFSLVMMSGNIPSGPIHDLAYHLKMAEIGSTLSPRHLMEVSDTLRTARVIKSFIVKSTGEENKIPLLKGMVDMITYLKDVEDEINNAIIGENEISDNASRELKNIRRSIENKNSAIRNKLDSIVSSSSMQKFLQDSLVTIRQDRFVIPVKAEHRSSIKGLVHDQSSSGSTLYIEPMAVVDLNNQLKELRMKEQAEIERILLELTMKVGENHDLVRINQTQLVNIDFIIAKGKLAYRMNGVEPKFNTNGFVKIKKGRHPLIDKKEVVANDFELGKGFRTLLITGPNTGGKTVTLKTVGLLSLMAQSGLHIPANHGSELSIFDSIYADIGDEQSIEQSLSTFSSHMTNIVDILDNVTRNSLVLFDELGAGTDPTEGAALAMAILNKLFNMGVSTIATTHYSELKQYALTKEGIENACVEFDVNSLSPTYKLLIGIPGKSNAFEISRKLGLRDELISDAKVFIENENIEFEDIISSIEDNRKKSEEERDEAVKLRLEVETLKKRLENSKEKLANQKEKILSNAKKEARDILKKAKDESDEILREFRKLKNVKGKVDNKKLEGMRSKVRGSLDNLQEKSVPDVVYNHEVPKNLKVGDKVKLLNLDQEGYVSTLPDNKGNLMVQVGIMKLNSNVKNLRLVVEKDELSVQSGGYSSNFKSKTQSVKNEIDVRGQNLEEAIELLDKYLDDVYLSNLQNITIIHGKGTGILRKGIREYLKKHKAVAEYREGAYGEGDSGVTVVKMR